MTPQELKNSILQLAIQGKLVEQRPEEGTAEELFARIQEEKQRLIKEKKIKKEKPFSKITEKEKPFDIPESWKWVRFGEVFDITMGQSPKGTSVSENGDGIEFHQGKIYFGDDYLGKSPQTTDEITKIAESNSILLCVRAPVGVVNIVEREICIGRGLCALTSHGIINERFMLFFIRAFQNDFKKKSTGTTFKAITNEVVKNQLFPLPPLDEQKRIVVKIEELLPYIKRYEQAWSKLKKFNSRFPEDMKKSILQYAIQGKLVEQRPEEGTAEELFEQIQKEKQRLIAEKKIKKEKSLPDIKEEEKPFDIPGSWKWVRLGDISIFQGGYAYKSTSYILKSNNQVIRLGNIKQGDFLPSEKQVFISDDLANETDQYRIKANDILISMTGTRRKKDYFYAVIIDQNMLKDTAYYLNQRVGCFRTFKNIYPQFLYYALRCETLREIIFTKETGTANQGNLGSEDIKKYVYIPLPPLAEQKRIVQKLEQLLPLCEQLR